MIKKIISTFLFALWTAAIFLSGYILGAKGTFELVNKEIEKQLSAAGSQTKVVQSPKPTPVSTPLPNTAKKGIDYSGPQLWEAVNKARVEQGVQPLKQRDILCTIAAIRLSQIRELGKLDNHDGFQGVFNKYKDDPNMPNNVSEFLISGYPTPDQAVAGWLDTLGHKKLITGGEYVWGCIYAQDGFGVAITGY